MSPLNMKLSKYVLPALFIFGIGGQKSAYAQDSMRQDVKITLTVLAAPCVIKTEDKAMEVYLGRILNRDLYQNHRTPGQNFELHLEECDPRVAQSLKIRFMGPESRALPGLLAFGADSRASGAAIGMESIDGKPLPFNKVSKFPLSRTSSSNVIPFRAYVKAEPRAIQQNRIGAGAFSAIATFEVSYE
ncbi:type 1 fimbrial protein [Xenorhabdus bovienii]|uniref:fimbrial protein n=1 Tax=Xenorhabdus bovienii TaxID=40576 RepID=UPI0023B2B263|nr:fimbrial protein [Xenorhabdus bovienii]MDE9445861.1 type 1 fimbrial protein [Xenorhabdus bovienii]